MADRLIKAFKEDKIVHMAVVPSGTKHSVIDKIMKAHNVEYDYYAVLRPLGKVVLKVIDNTGTIIMRSLTRL